MFFRRKQTLLQLKWDPNEKTPALRCSICTGEQVAGFMNSKTGKFEDVGLIRSPQELQAFMQACGVTELLRIY